MAPSSSIDVEPKLLTKKPPGTLGSKLLFQTNVYPLDIIKKKPFYKFDFRVNVTINLGENKTCTRELTNACRFYEDEIRKTCCVKILRNIAERPDMRRHSLTYDRGAIIFSMTEIISKAQDKLEFSVPKEVVIDEPLFANVIDIIVTLKRAADSYQITSDDFKAAAAADFKVGGDKSIFEFLNIMTSHVVVDYPEDFCADSRSRIYLMHPDQFQMEEKDIGSGQYLSVSIKKSVKTVEGTDKANPIAVIVVDTTKTARHCEMSLIEKMFNLRVPQPLLIGLQVKKTYGNKELFKIKGFSNGPISQTVIDYNGKKISLPEFMRTKYKINIRHGDKIGVLDYKGNVFAPELLNVIDQKVLQTQSTSDTNRQVIRENAVVPEEKMKAVEKLTKALDLSSSRAVDSGVTLSKNGKSIQAPGRLLPSCKLAYGKMNGKMITSVGFVPRVVNPAFFTTTVEKWAFIVNGNRDYSGVVDILKNKARSIGLILPNPISFNVSNGNLEQLDGTLKKAKDTGCSYAFIISDITGDHHTIKMAERKYGICTQHLQGRTAAKLHADTGSNVALKMNVKTGGINHVVIDNEILDKDTLLIMSLVFDHPSSMKKADIENGARPTMPSVIGISSNATAIVLNEKVLPESSQYFIEKIAYANPREWRVNGEDTFETTLCSLIKNEISEFRSKRGKVPREFIVYIGGVSEAERAYWSGTGRELFRSVFKSISEQFNPPLAIITTSEEGMERIVPEGKTSKGPDPRIGLVVDTVIVNPYLNEFFLQSAKPLQGTARSIKYTLVAESDAKKFTMDQLESLTWSLTHLHQYCGSPIGEPVVARIASEAAKRAKDLFTHYLSNKKRGFVYDLKTINEEMGYLNPNLASARTV